MSSLITFTLHKPTNIRYPIILLDQITDACVRHRIGRKMVISLVWVDEKRMTDLNRRYRGKSVPTNVLTFPYEQEHTPYAAEIVLCRNIIAKDAKKRSLRIEEETTHLIIHGILHIMGYEHTTGRGKRHLEHTEQVLLEEIYGKSFDALHT